MGMTHRDPHTKLERVSGLPLYTSTVVHRGTSVEVRCGAQKVTTPGRSPSSSVRVAAPTAAAPGAPPAEAEAGGGGGWTVLDTYAHDRRAFTQGFALRPEDRRRGGGERGERDRGEGGGGMGVMYEGTGLYGRSELRRVDVATGKVLARAAALDKSFFGEGIALWRDSVLQLTWKRKTGFVYDRETLEETSRFAYDTHTGQGWGLTHDGARLIVSDGSHFLHFWDPERPGHEVRDRLAVTDPDNRIGAASAGSEKRRAAGHTPQFKRGPNGEVGLLNELEWFRGTVLANIWYDDRIVQIDPDTGVVLAAWDFSDLQLKSREWHKGQDCLNGIAVLDEDSGELLLTGKLWRRAYRVKVDALVKKSVV